MKTFFLALSFLASLTAAADTVSYRLYEDSIDQFTPFVLSIEVEGSFKAGAKIKSVVLKEVLRSGTTKLFDLKDELNLKWNSDNTLVMTAKDTLFKAVVKTEISNGYGDTSINPDDEYSLYFDKEIVLNEKGSMDDTRFEIANQTVEESCLWGILKK
jgi:hypothetical protein